MSLQALDNLQTHTPVILILSQGLGHNIRIAYKGCIRTTDKGKSITREELLGRYSPSAHLERRGKEKEADAVGGNGMKGTGTISFSDNSAHTTTN